MAGALKKSASRFSVIVPAHAMTHEEMLDVTDALGDAGCTDASIRGHAAGMELLFERDADSLQSAITAAIADVRAGKPQLLPQKHPQLLRLRRIEHRVQATDDRIGSGEGIDGAMSALPASRSRAGMHRGGRLATPTPSAHDQRVRAERMPMLLRDTGMALL